MATARATNNTRIAQIQVTWNLWRGRPHYFPQRHPETSTMKVKTQQFSKWIRAILTSHIVVLETSKYDFTKDSEFNPFPIWKKNRYMGQRYNANIRKIAELGNLSFMLFKIINLIDYHFTKKNVSL